jgi:hypothetical protein
LNFKHALSWALQEQQQQKSLIRVLKLDQNIKAGATTACWNIKQTSFKH